MFFFGNVFQQNHRTSCEVWLEGLDFAAQATIASFSTASGLLGAIPIPGARVFVVPSQVSMILALAGIYKVWELVKKHTLMWSFNMFQPAWMTVSHSYFLDPTCFGWARNRASKPVRTLGWMFPSRLVESSSIFCKTRWSCPKRPHCTCAFPLRRLLRPRFPHTFWEKPWSWCHI